MATSIANVLGSHFISFLQVEFSKKKFFNNINQNCGAMCEDRGYGFPSHVLDGLAASACRMSIKT